MNRLFAIALAVCIISLGCDGKPDKAAVEKKIRGGLAKASAEWKDITYETKANDTVSAVGATRSIDGKPYWFSFTGGGGSGGVAVRGPGGQWLCKYLYEKGAETSSEKMTGTGEDVAKFRSLAAEFATVCIAASS
jgi:hypothetical protein